MPQDMKALKRDEEVMLGSTEPALEGLLTPERVAQMLGVSKAMVYKLVRKGQLEAVHVGRLVRFTRENYRQFVDRSSSAGLRSLKIDDSLFTKRTG